MMHAPAISLLHLWSYVDIPNRQPYKYIGVLTLIVMELSLAGAYKHTGDRELTCKHTGEQELTNTGEQELTNTWESGSL